MGRTVAWVLLAMFIIVLWIRRQSLRGAIQFVAKRFGGMTASSTFWLWGFPRAIFRYHDQTVSVTAKSGLPFLGGQKTLVQLPWPDTDFVLVVSSRARRVRRYTRGLQPLPIDTAASTLFAWTNDPHKAKSLLVGPVVWQLQQLRDRGRWGRMVLRIRKQRMLVSVGGHFLADERLHDLVVTALQLYDQMQLCQQSELEFVAPDDARIVDDFHCPVCSGRSSEPIVLCQRCKTPHCLECWQFNGRCATYGCGETKCIKA